MTTFTTEDRQAAQGLLVIDQIRHWAHERNLIEGSDPKSQLLKTMSELGELADAINKNRTAEIIDGIGDVVVTLVIIAAQLDLHFEGCIEAAYAEIKDRKGRMVNGVFIKN